MSLAVRYTSCKSCNASFQIRSEKCLYYVCTECGSIHIRYESDVSKVFTSPPVPEDMTVLRVGAEGIVNSKRFRITGRIRYEFENAYLNHWNILYEDGAIGFLGESYGSYLISQKDESGIAHDQLVQLKTGKEIVTNGKKKFYLTGVRTNTGHTAEGELFEKAQVERGFVHIEMAGTGKEAAYVNFFSKAHVDIYLGSYFDFSDLNFNDIRDLHEWK